MLKLVCAILIALVARWMWTSSNNSVDLHNTLSRLIVSDDLPATYLPELSSYRRLTGVRQNTSNDLPDTTAVVLNWSRFPNVRFISALLCGPWLDTVIAEVFIWNNSPKQISYKDFAGTGCSPSKLKIYNSPANLYFQARFMGCAESQTEYCFTQDDDYLVQPEVIQTLHTRLSTAPLSDAIHLLPPHEHLTTALREIHTNSTQQSTDGIHASFAWLGHGTFLRRSQAVQFLSLMHALNASQDEMNMADNYFTLLHNKIPEVWFDQGIELGGGQPFTTGTEGHERNMRHIIRATEYLQLINELHSSAPGLMYPYVSLKRDDSAPNTLTRAVCRGLPCLIETNIELLPEGMIHTGNNMNDLVAVETRNRVLLGEHNVQRYLEHGPSNMVDGRTNTSFQSFKNAEVGDTIILDMLGEIPITYPPTMESAWLVDSHTASVLNACVFSSSTDGINWVDIPRQLVCRNAPLKPTSPTMAVTQECSVQIPSLSETHKGLRFIRTQLRSKDQPEPWHVIELWLRILNPELSQTKDGGAQPT